MTYLPPAAAYAHIKNYLKEGLSAGRWPPGTLMPSESELVTQFSVSRMTANRAVRELQAEGLVERVQGVGTFATQPYRASSTLTIRDLHDEITERGHRHRSEVHLARAEAVSETLAQRMGLPAGSEVFHTLIVHSENGVPLLCEDRYVNPARAPDYLSVDFTRTTPTNYLLTVAPLWEAQYSIEAQLPTAEEAQLLGVKPSEPCLIVVRRTESQGSPITLARLVHPGSRYTIEGSFKP
ncbi:histidine utilization repressor [Cupriavidus basilensis]|uniref:Histidine utilization repressor n=1 Tax=Cupriavidus basilensis TaxID=68895 RepID=A0ABT6AKN0_9BURK|nr:histidine utilization repressor [Cupriavidus basilensis]MDF3833164.1 histidine utilization repressor [Cupriavidus basilensis]